MNENKKSPQVGERTCEDVEIKPIIYFYKENGENHPVLVSEGNNIRSILSAKHREQIQSKFPKTENNLYVLIHGVEFRL